MTGLELALILALAQPPQPTVTLILRGEDRTVSVVEAERLLQSPDQRLQTAATIALGTYGTSTTVPGLPNTRARLDWEIRRGVRRPAQAQ
jgi:hypothetical protein